MKRIVYLLLCLFIAMPAVAQVQNGPRMSLDGSIHSPTASYSIDGTLGHIAARMSAIGGDSSLFDLRTNTSGGDYASGGTQFSFYPLIGADGTGDRVRAQHYIRMNTVLDGSQTEIGLVISANMQTGYVPPYANSTAYSVGALVNNASNWTYRVTQAGTSAATGAGPSTDGTSPITDGTVKFTFVCHSCNARSGLFVDAVAGPGAGSVWGSFSNMKLLPGWHGGFSAGWEIDSQNNSGTDCTSCQTLFLTGDLGTNLEQAVVSVYTPPVAGRYKWIEGIRIAGSSSVRDQSIADYANATRSYYDVGSHAYGLYMAGTYSSGYAVQANGRIRMAIDTPVLEFDATSTANLNRWRILSGISGTLDGSLGFQHTTDAFGSNFTTPVQMNADGSVTLGGALQMPGRNVSALPACNTAATGTIIFVLDANAPTYNGALTGGGSVKTLALCNGTAWTAH